MEIGFIGLGTMGYHMAANLQTAGYRLIVNDLRRARGAADCERIELGTNPTGSGGSLRGYFHVSPWSE